MGMVPPRPLLPVPGFERQYVLPGTGELYAIHAIGRAEPIGYLDRKSGHIYRVEDEPLPAQYEDALVDYREC